MAPCKWIIIIIINIIIIIIIIVSVITIIIITTNITLIALKLHCWKICQITVIIACSCETELALLVALIIMKPVHQIQWPHAFFDSMRTMMMNVTMIMIMIIMMV